MAVAYRKIISGKIMEAHTLPSKTGNGNESFAEVSIDCDEYSDVLCVKQYFDMPVRNDVAHSLVGKPVTVMVEVLDRGDSK